MNDSTVTSHLMEQTTRTVTLKSGLTVQMCPMPGFVSAYAMLTVGFGSIDIGYQIGSRKYYLPAGVAHYMEHKMFDCPYGDAMDHFSQSGANANAFTSFDKTAYYFSCTDRFTDSLAILLDFVSKPYFHKASVERERGIIAEEIRMYRDSPDWVVMGNLLELLYHKHPVRIDIAGTEESISHIDHHLLHRAYDRFYRPDNMVLSVAGNFCEEDVLCLAEQYLGTQILCKAKPMECDEPQTVLGNYRERHMPIATPVFEIGFKAPKTTGIRNMENRILNELLLDLIGGETTALYRELYEAGQINATFGSEVMAGRDFTCGLFDGESREPKRVYESLCAHIDRLCKDGISKEDFIRCKKANYGRYIGMYSREDSVAGLMASAHFSGMQDIYYPLEIIKNATVDQLMERLCTDYDPQHSALSVILPEKETQQKDINVL